MTMKAKKLTIAAAILSAIAITGAARTAEGLKIYINPGHGGHDPNDRNVVIAPYAAGDPEGYWESNSNLSKGLQLRDMLEAKGYKVVMSRVTNTSADDLDLGVIVRLSNESNADLFFSIHSNATGTSVRRNFPLMLHRGYDNDPVKPADRDVCVVLNKHLLDNQATVWTSTSQNIRGDWSFYPQWGKSGLGVLRGNNIVGMLSEGSFHDYVPEAYRLMNDDFCWLEAWHFRKAIDEYLGVDGLETGVVCGRLNDQRLPREGSYIKFGDDKLAVIMNADVELVDENGTVVGTYKTDDVDVNGFYLFKDVKPGKYTVRADAESYQHAECAVTVTADEVSYCNMRMARVRNTPPKVESYTPVWEDGQEGMLCNTPVTIQFNWDMDTEATEKAFSITPPVEGEFTWEDLNYRMVFTPTKPYDISTLYTVTLTTDAAHAGGSKMEEPLTFSFRTSDRNYMNILGHYPKDGDEVHYSGAQIEFRFDKNPDTRTVYDDITCTGADGTKVSFNRRKASSSSAKDPYGYFRIPIIGNLTIGETYSLTLSNSLSDYDGITIKEPVSITFKAVDAKTEKEGFKEVDNMYGDTYAFDAEASTDVVSAKASKSTTQKLFQGVQKFDYKFAGTEGFVGEVRFGRTDGAAQTILPGATVGVHVYGDLTGNSVYFELASDVSTQYLHVTDLDFLGWHYIEVPATVAEAPSQLTGIKIVEQPTQMSKSGTIYIDNIYTTEDAGIDDVTADQTTGVTVYPNPASEYLIANGPVVISSVRLVDMNGRLVAASAGNVLNVSDTAQGNYFMIVRTASSQTVHKVIIKH